jgi:hypothetical protein
MRLASLVCTLVISLTATVALARPGDPSPAPVPAPPGQPGVDTVQNPPPGTAEAAIAAILQAGLDGNFKAYLAEILPSEREVDEQVKQIEKYQWKRFKGNAGKYVSARKPVAFQVTKREPDGDDKLKVFVKDQTQADRMPVPVQLRKQGARWWVYANSL